MIFHTLQFMPLPVYETTLSLRYQELVQVCLDVVVESRPSSGKLLERRLAHAASRIERSFLSRLMSG